MDPNSVQAMIDGADNDDSLSLLSYDSCSDDLGSLPTDEAEQEQLMDELDAPRTAELRAPITPGAAESTTLTAERLTEWIEVQRPLSRPERITWLAYILPLCSSPTLR